MNLNTISPGVKSVLRKALFDRISMIDDTLEGMTQREAAGEETTWIGHRAIFEREKLECQTLLQNL